MFERAARWAAMYHMAGEARMHRTLSSYVLFTISHRLVVLLLHFLYFYLH